MPGRNCIERLENIQTAFIEIFGDTFAALALSQSAFERYLPERNPEARL
jgi:hypothetical protein